MSGGNPKSKTWKRATRPQALFLTTAFQINSALLRPLYGWFGNGIISLPTLAPLNLLPSLEKLDDPAYKARVLELLGAADIHIADIKVSRMPGHQFEMKPEPGKLPELKAWQGEFLDTQFCHQVEGGEPVWFDRHNESFGTQRLLGYAGPLLDAIENGRLLVVDEFDTCLHSLLTRYLLGLIQSPELSTKGAQLLMTTHDTTLLDPEILRRDQVWFVEKTRASRKAWCI